MAARWTRALAGTLLTGLMTGAAAATPGDDGSTPPSPRDAAGRVQAPDASFRAAAGRAPAPDDSRPGARGLSEVTAQAQASEAPSERDRVLAAVQRFFDTMRTRDADAWQELLVADGNTWRWRRNGEGAWQVRQSTNDEATARLREGDALYEERMYAPTVLLRGPIAVVWTPYTFHLDGAFSHCGIDSFNLMKIEGRWRLADAMWTVEEDEAECASWLPAAARTGGDAG